jgi:hypothetical protein
MTVPITIFGLDWHLRQSPAQRILIHEPLQPYIQFTQIPWDGENLPVLTTSRKNSDPLVFFQLPPPRELLQQQDRRLVWIPMWDEARGYPREWWAKLPKTLRIVSFSKQVSERCALAGLETLNLKYYLSPEKYSQASWEGGRTLFYWNRSALVGKAFLTAFCQSLNIVKLIYLRNGKTGIPARLAYALPERLGGAYVRTVEADQFLPQDDYLELFHQANVFIAPRASEGVGLFFLEALAQGCAVFAFDAATMNEYILHKENGYLFRRFGRNNWNRLRGGIAWRIDKYQNRLFQREKRRQYSISDWQNWREIERLDLQTFGYRARQEQSRGFNDWLASIPHLASFLMDW